MSSFLCGIMCATASCCTSYLLRIRLSEVVYRNEPGTLVICQRGHTRSHSEHGSQALENRWYSKGESR